jgi:hypothetical protein
LVDLAPQCHAPIGIDAIQRGGIKNPPEAHRWDAPIRGGRPRTWRIASWTAPVRIAVSDVTENRPAVRDYLLTLDAFTVPGNDVIYVVQQSQLLKGAHSGPLHRAILATVVWHEMAHLSGADERGARQAEEKPWMQFVRDGLVDRVTGLRYLQALKRRPDDDRLRAGKRGLVGDF